MTKDPVGSISNTLELEAELIFADKDFIMQQFAMNFFEYHLKSELDALNISLTPTNQTTQAKKVVLKTITTPLKSGLRELKTFVKPLMNVDSPILELYTTFIFFLLFNSSTSFCSP